MSAVLLFACFFKTEKAILCNPCCRTFFCQSFSNVDAVYRALESRLSPPRPIGQRPGRVWPGWDQSPWPRSMWSGLSRFLNVLIPTRAALPNRPLSDVALALLRLGDAFVSPSRPLGAFGWFGQAHDSIG